jgi:flagellar FliL protein
MAAKVEEKAAEAPKGGGKMKLIIIALAAVILIAGVAVVMFKMKSAKHSGKPEKKEVVKVEFPLGDFTVNLADESQIRYLKTSIVLEITEEAAEALKGEGGEGGGEGEASAPAPIRDTVIQVLSSHTFNELLKAEGRTKLKEEIIKAVNERLHKGEALDAYFSEFAMQ